jgi:hypothetical protein
MESCVVYSLYNANANHFCAATLLAEFPIVGGVIVSSDFSIHKLRRYMSASDRTLIVFEVAFLLFGMLYFLLEIQQMRREKCRYFLSGYNVLDTVLCGLVFAIAFLHVYCLWLETVSSLLNIDRCSFFLSTSLCLCLL